VDPSDPSHLSPDPGLPTAVPSRTKAARRRLRHLRIDLSPLRSSRDYRLNFVGSMVSMFGSMITYVTIPYQVAELTHSPLAVGLLGLCELVPILLMAFVGGALADYLDRRRLVLLSELGLTVVTGTLLLDATLDHPLVWPLYVCSTMAAGLDGIQRPALDSMIPRLVEPAQIPAASALDSLRMNVAAVAGPAVAGLRYARSRPELLGTYLIDINAMFFGMPMALFPFMADRLGGPHILGLLYAAPSAGAIVATLTSGWTNHVYRHGLMVVLAAVGWGAAIVGFGLVDTVWPALTFLAVAGFADSISGFFRGIIWNQTIPDHLRGRLAGIEMVSYTSGPLLGNAESGLAASVFSVRTSIVSGGALCIIGTGVMALALPAFLRYDGRRGLAVKQAVDAARATGPGHP